MTTFGLEKSKTSIVIGTAAVVATFYWLKRTRRLLDTDERYILITGCDSGLGYLLAGQAAKAGFRVIAACYTKEGAKRLTDENSQIQVIVSNLMTQEGRQAVVKAAQEACDNRGLFGLVNNAGLVLPGHVDWLKPRVYQDHMNLNFYAPVELTYELLPLIKRAKGRIMNVTSVDGFLCFPSNAAYCASKHALEAFSDCLRCEMLPWGVKVVVLQPATMKTPLAGNYADGFHRSFHEADADRQALYGSAWVEEQCQNLDMTTIAADPQPTVRALLRALRLEHPPARIMTGFLAHVLWKPVSYLPDLTRDRVLHWLTYRSLTRRPQGLEIPHPPGNKISHVTIRVSNLTRSVEFYSKLGFEPVEKPLNGQQFLKGGGFGDFKRMILLVQDSSFKSPRAPCHNIGMTRLCLYTTNLDQQIQRLSQRGLEPAFPVSGSTVGRDAAYMDPDGFVVYFVNMWGGAGIMMKGVKAAMKVTEPWILHVSINVSDYDKASKALDAMGFKTVSYQNKNQVYQDMLPAFGLDPNDTVIEHIKMSVLPGHDQIIATIMQWSNPVSSKTGHELSNSMSISVKNVEQALRKAKNAGMVVQERIEERTLPYYGKVQVGTAFLEENANPIEFVAF